MILVSQGNEDIVQGNAWIWFAEEAMCNVLEYRFNLCDDLCICRSM